MNCDVCGQEIVGKPLKVEIEGARLIACARCSQLGEPIAEVATQRVLRPRRRTPPGRRFVQRASVQGRTDVLQMDVVENCSGIVRTAREKLGFSQGELAKKMNEKVTVIQRIETGKIVPDLRLARTLEHFLRVKLLASVDTSVPPSNLSGKPSTSVTLGDIVQIRKRSPPK